MNCPGCEAEEVRARESRRALLLAFMAIERDLDEKERAPQ